MILLSDIRTAIIKLLRDKTDIQCITGEDIEQSKDYFRELGQQDGSEENQSLLHVQLQPVNSNVAAAGYHVDKSILVTISYMETLRTSNTKIYEMLEQLDQIFKPCLRVGKRAFKVDASMNITDDIGNYTFIIEFTDTVPFEPAGCMEELNVGLEAGTGPA